MPSNRRMTMMRPLAKIRSIIMIASTLLTMMAATPVPAQQLGPDGAPNPTASVASEQKLLQQSPRIEGEIAQPNERERVLMQPAGRQWDYFHEVLLHWLGAIVILGMIAALAAAYLIIGRLRISKGRSGRKMQRFNAFERFPHWLTAISFVVLGVARFNNPFSHSMLFH